MNPITSPQKRDIVEDFAELIRERKSKGSKPEKTVINFRNEKADQFERSIFQVPVELIRYRKDNGRIASDVLGHERKFGLLIERDTETQQILEGFLRAKDPDRTEELMLTIEHGGQNEPAIITCDGFLINGNRRKMAFEGLRKKFPGVAAYEFMKVVILPGNGEEGGEPTLIEIEQLENRYQLQRDGKAEYYGFDQALAFRRKIDMGYSVEAQLLDDPRYARLKGSEIKNEIRKIENEYLNPLKCVDAYLGHFDEDGRYDRISSGRGDREGRWEAFKDFSKTYHRKLTDNGWKIKQGVSDSEATEIITAAFNIIRLRDIKSPKKLSQIMREFHNQVDNKESRKIYIRQGKDVEAPKTSETLNQENDWIKKNASTIIYSVRKASEEHELVVGVETPLKRLQDALKKLNHDELDVSSMSASDYDTARKIASEIQKRANEIEGEIYKAKKNYDDLVRK
jgi:hypothetical protein